MSVLCGGRRVISSWLAFPGIASPKCLIRSSLPVRHQGVKPFKVTRIFADDDGNTKFGQFEISMEGSGEIGYLSKLFQATGLKFRLTPADYLYEWHRAPQRQFIVNLDGDVEVEVSTGERRIIKQGEVFFVEDVKGKGHFSRAVANRPRHSLFIPVSEEFIAEDC